MLIKVRVPLSFCNFTGNTTEIQSNGDTLEELLANLTAQYPGIKELLYDEEGSLRPSLSLFVNGRIVKFLKKEAISLKSGDVILLMQLIAGG